MRPADVTSNYACMSCMKLMTNFSLVQKPCLHKWVYDSLWNLPFRSLRRMLSYAITGASRGIGLGFVKSLAANPSTTVFALVRDVSSASSLHEFVDGHNYQNVHILKADLNDVASIKAASEEVAKITKGTLDVLINNAALVYQERINMMLDEFPDEKSLEEDMIDFYKTNTLGTIHMINAFLPLLRAGGTKKCIIIGSALASTKLARNTGVIRFSGYAMSKSALNIAGVRYATKYRSEGVIFLTITPGLVKTLQGKPDEVDKFFAKEEERIRQQFPQFEGSITVEQSVHDQLALISRVTIDQSGAFVNRDGTDLENEGYIKEM
ncbi:NAD(P)-binding protein [Schizopora paradoxa]|uniref:NAD(P)-binding protein n=1 Tax=Schizopora paradoxa TaxID=27342 RepID=A0A0H2RMQ6_9AGAM|nr:NAD(P)-binding protein [Schizopora paradoxa]